MTDATELRKLAAIMFTDMVGYSALSQRDEKLAQELLEEHRQLLREIFPRFNGTEIKTIGDAFLVEFNSALEAAQCAIEIQRALAHRNADAAIDHQIELKIGIHIGDVVHRGGDVYGDGVNIASRIEPLAGAGGICVSMDVERQIRNAVETRFEKLAPTELKNISVQMDLFRIVLPWERKPEVRSEIRRGEDQKSAVREGVAAPAGRRFAWIGGLALLLIIGIGWWWTTLPHKNPAPLGPEGGQPKNVPEKSIAVLPFENLSHDPDNAYFADGIQDEILTRLSKVAALKVISRTSTQKYKSAPDNLREVGKQLGVATLLEGSVQKIANAVHINVQLIRTATDEHLWAESYNRKLDDVFGVEGEVASAIAEQLNAKLTGSEAKAVTEKPTQNPAAYDAYLRGVSIEQSRTDDAGQDTALASYATAVRLDPNFALAWAHLALIRSNFYFFGGNPAENSASAVKEAADRAISLQPELGEAFIAQGAYRYRVLRDFPGALESYGEAVKRLPNSSLALENLALVERRVGRWDIAEKHFRAAVDLDPRNVDSLSNLAQFFSLIRKFSEAQDTYDRVLQIAPNDEVTLASKAGLYQREGRLPEAAQELKKISAHSLNIGVDIGKALQCSYERHFEEAIATLKSSAVPDILTDARTMIVIGFWQQCLGRNNEARESINRGIKTVQPTPDAIIPVDSRTLRSFLALGYAVLGEKDKALSEARVAVNDYQNDLVSRPSAEMFLAVIQARLGDADSAIAALPHLLEVQNGITVGDLRINPFWDPLRKDPRFQKLVGQTETK
jgi:TolB-like protein/class 3 adenylate cyclase/Tfp pilus assembly protein PilF